MSHSEAAYVGLAARRRADRRGKVHNAIVRFTAYGVALVLAVLALAVALPPIVADQSDRAILDARVTLLTTPIAGEVSHISSSPGPTPDSSNVAAEVHNPRIDDTTLVTLSSKVAELREKVASTGGEKQSDLHYLASLDKAINAERNELVAQSTQQIAALQGKVGSAQAEVETKQALHDRQVKLLARNDVSPDMLKPGTHQLSGAGALRNSAAAQLAAAKTRLAGVRDNVFVGDNMFTAATLAQKRRDVSFDADREGIKESAAQTALDHMSSLLKQEKARVASLRDAKLAAPPQRELLRIGVAQGRHVNAGDSLATLVDCKRLFAVAIFSYREASALTAGTRMWISGPGIQGQIGGTVKDIIPKSNEKTDELYAVAFPQTERREMYVIVEPDADAMQRMRGQQTSCPVGKWVTVSRADGWVPSTSVLWHRAQAALVHSLDSLWPHAEARPVVAVHRH